MTAQIEAVRAGLGLMLAPSPYAGLCGLGPVELARPLQRGVGAIPKGSLWLVGHRALREVPRISVVWDWLRDRLMPAASSTAQG